MTNIRASDTIPIHELESTNQDDRSFELIRLLPKKSESTTVPHRHDYYELFLFENGGGTHVIDFQELPITECTAHLVAPGQVHHLKRSRESVGFALPFKENFLRSNTENILFISKFAYMEMETYLPAFKFSKQEFNDMLALVKMIEKESTQNEDLNLDIISQYLNAIILNCRRKKVNTIGNQRSPEQQLYTEFRKQVNLNFRHFKKVKDFANLLNTTERQVNETSKRGCGKSASTVIFERIITEAKRLIANTDRSVKEICFELNYDDMGHFSKFFKKQVGLSPTQFRELYK